MKIIALTEAKDKLSSVIEDAKDNPTVITKNGKAAAVLIVPEDDQDLERLLLSRSRMLQDVLRERREEIQRGETISLEEAFAGNLNNKRVNSGKKVRSNS